jgi:acetyl esterase/lipase
LSDHGYLGMSINYKLSRKEARVAWPQCVYDAKTAVRWLRKNATRLNIDPERIGVFGCSAGGNLAGMLALTRPEDKLEPTGPDSEISTKVACAIDFYGAVDLINYHDMKMFDKTRAEAPELYKAASPLTYVHKDGAPMMIVHGTADETVPLSQSETLVKALKEAGAAPEFIVIPDAPHTFDLQPKQMDLRPAVLAFLDKHLKPEAAKP